MSCEAPRAAITPRSAPRQGLTAAPYANYVWRVPWSGLSGVPAGFSDGSDNDTQYGVGNGLVVSNNIFAVHSADPAAGRQRLHCRQHLCHLTRTARWFARWMTAV